MLAMKNMPATHSPETKSRAPRAKREGKLHTSSMALPTHMFALVSAKVCGVLRYVLGVYVSKRFGVQSTSAVKHASMP